MLKDRIQQYIKDSKGPIFEEEKAYLEKHELISIDISVEENTSTRFNNAYIERSDKETEEMIAVESADFLKEPLEYLKKHKNEFIYIESEWFELSGADAVSLEADDVFGNYDVMLGLKLQKKFEKVIRLYLNDHLNGNEKRFDLLFNQDDGLWNLNFALDDLPGFKEDSTIGEAYSLIYRFLFTLAAVAEA